MRDYLKWSVSVEGGRGGGEKQTLQNEEKKKTQPPTAAENAHSPPAHTEKRTGSQETTKADIQT